MAVLRFLIAALLVAMMVPAAEAQSRRPRRSRTTDYEIGSQGSLAGFSAYGNRGGSYGGNAYESNYSSRGHHVATQNNVNAWGIASLGASVLEAVILDRRAAKRQAELVAELRREQADRPARYERTSRDRTRRSGEDYPEPRNIEEQENLLIINQTSCRVFVGDLEAGRGIYLSPGQTRRVASVLVGENPEAWARPRGGTLTTVPVNRNGSTVSVGAAPDKEE